MRVLENLTSDLTVVDSRKIDGEVMVRDEQTGEVGDVITQTLSGQLLVQWQDFAESDEHEEFELVPLLAPNVKSVVVTNTGEIEIKRNPFFSDWRDRRKATKAFSKRLKAETVLKRAKRIEEAAEKRAKENPSRHRARVRYS